MNYYEILEIQPSASSTEIRIAYKRLAMQYHPDRNAGDKQAEEKFKVINEAYQVLSDPLKKSRYDSTNFTATKTTSTAGPDDHEAKRRKYYAYKKAQERTYVIDKNYYRVQALAFLTFLLLAGTCFGIIHTVNYFIDQREIAKWRESMEQLQKANAMFTTENFDGAFALIEELKLTHPFESRIRMAQDSLLLALRDKADNSYLEKRFDDAAIYYSVLSKRQKPQKMEVIQQLAKCYYYQEKYELAIDQLEQLRSQEPWNLELLYEVGLIYFEKLNDLEHAEKYFTEGKKLFVSNMSSVYGEAFEIIINPKKVPTIYYDIFMMRGKTNLELHNDQEAITDFNWAVFLKPDLGEAYRLRAEGKLRVSKPSEACEDLVKSRERGTNVDDMMRRYCR